MIHGDKDELVPLRNSERILEAFKGAGVATELIVIPGGKHGFEGAHAETARRRDGPLVRDPSRRRASGRAGARPAGR